MRTTAALAALFILAAAGCGGGSAHDILSTTSSNLAKIGSGKLTLRLVVSPREGTKGRVGFELRGPFALRPGGLPVTRMRYTQISGARQATATFVSTGSRAFAEVAGKAYRLPAGSVQSLRQIGGASGKSAGLGQFRIESWVQNPVVTEGGDIGGATTDHVSGKLDVVATANDLLGFVRQLGRNSRVIEGDQASKLQAAVESSSFDLWTGKQDHLLRRLLIHTNLGFGVPAALRQALGDVVGAKIEFELAVSDPNKPVRVAPPTNPLPSSQLPGG